MYVYEALAIRKEFEHWQTRARLGSLFGTLGDCTSFSFMLDQSLESWFWNAWPPRHRSRWRCMQKFERILSSASIFVAESTLTKRLQHLCLDYCRSVMIWNSYMDLLCNLCSDSKDCTKMVHCRSPCRGPSCMLTQQQPPSSSFELLEFPVSVLRLKAKLPTRYTNIWHQLHSFQNYTMYETYRCMLHVSKR